jgi:hypothetical protein
MIKSYLLKIPIFKDFRGSLGVVEKCIYFKINRIFFIYDLKKKRAEHAHQKNKQLLICLKGRIKVNIEKKKVKKSFELSSPSIGLYLYPDDWHSIFPISKNPILVSICSQGFDKKDYFYEK